MNINNLFRSNFIQIKYQDLVIKLQSSDIEVDKFVLICRLYDLTDLALKVFIAAPESLRDQLQVKFHSETIQAIYYDPVVGSKLNPSLELSMNKIKPIQSDPIDKIDPERMDKYWDYCLKIKQKDNLRIIAHTFNKQISNFGELFVQKFMSNHLTLKRKFDRGNLRFNLLIVFLDLSVQFGLRLEQIKRLFEDIARDIKGNLANLFDLEYLQYVEIILALQPDLNTDLERNFKDTIAKFAPESGYYDIMNTYLLLNKKEYFTNFSYNVERVHEKIKGIHQLIDN